MRQIIVHGKVVILMNKNEYNFNILVSSNNQKDSSVSEIFNTIACDENLKATFKIMILYSIFISEQSVDKGINLKLRLRYLRDLENNEKKLYLNLFNQNIGLSKELNKDMDRRTYSSEISLPISGFNIEAGRITINSDIKFPGYGKYQLELYYKTNSDEKETIATVYPITVKKMK